MGVERVAWKKATTWGTAIALNSAGRGFHLLNTGDFDGDQEHFFDKSIGINWDKYVSIGKREFNPEIEGYLRFSGPTCEMIAQVMGADSVATGSGDSVHTMEAQYSTAGLFGTMVVYDGTKYREAPSIKWTGLNISGSAADNFRFKLKGIGNKVIDSGQVNTSLSSIDPVTYFPIAPYNVQVRINAQSGSALGSGHVVKTSSLEIDFERPFDPDYVTNSTLYESDEPIIAGTPKVIIRMDFPSYQTNYLTPRADMLAGTILKLDITITGPATGNGGSYYTWLVQVPAAVVKVKTPVENDNKPVRQSLEFTCLESQSAVVSGMTGITAPLNFAVLNLTSTGFLA